MSKTYSDPTANTAIGSLDKELERMRKRVKQLRALRKEGLLTPQAQALARSRFSTGMVRRLFDAAMDAPESEQGQAEMQ